MGEEGGRRRRREGSQVSAQLAGGADPAAEHRKLRHLQLRHSKSRHLQLRHLQWRHLQLRHLQFRHSKLRHLQLRQLQLRHSLTLTILASFLHFIKTNIQQSALRPIVEMTGEFIV